MVSQYCCLTALSAITWAIVDPDLSLHKVSLGHNESGFYYSIKFRCVVVENSANFVQPIRQYMLYLPQKMMTNIHDFVSHPEKTMS